MQDSLNSCDTTAQHLRALLLRSLLKANSNSSQNSGNSTMAAVSWIENSIVSIPAPQLPATFPL